MQNQLGATSAICGQAAGRRAAWSVSLPLLTGLYVYLYFLFQGSELLLDGDTYSHVAAGNWILQHGAVPTQDPFSYTMPGAPWTAFEWLSQVILAVVQQSWGWTGLVALTALAFAITVSLLTQALMRYLEPIYVVLFTMLAVAMTTGHVLARPHMLAMPLMMAWTVEIVTASEERRAPAAWLVPLMVVWANLHGSFTLGLALAAVFAVEAVMAARVRHRARETARAWVIFLALALGASFLTPHGARGLHVTWQVMFQDQYALERIGEWRSPNFHTPQPLELFLLGGFAVALYQGLRIPPLRLALFLGFVHLSLKHIRYVELLGLLSPLVLAQPLGAQWRQRTQAHQQFQLADRLLSRLMQPAGPATLALSLMAVLAITLWMSNARPVAPPPSIAPIAALQAARRADLRGPVLNGYEWGGYLIYSGRPVFIDGRSDMYRDAFIKQYVNALELQTPDGLQALLEKYKVQWTLLPPSLAGVAMLDHLPGWRRVYADPVAVIHARTAPPEQTTSKVGVP